MKRGPVTTFVFLLLTVSTVFAQQRWSAGPRVGLNLSSFVGDVDNMKLLPGVAVGGFFMYSDINHFGISTDILFSQKGTRYKITEPNGVYRYTQRLNYLEIPVLFRYFLNKSGEFRPNLFVGPSLGVKLNGNRTDPDREYDNGAIFRPADLGATVGISLNFRVRQRQRLHIDGRYTYGLTDITPAAGDIRNSTISILLGYGFGIGRNY